MSKMRHNPVNKPPRREPEYKTDEPKTQERPKTVCPNCGHETVIVIGSGGTTQEDARCTECGTVLSTQLGQGSDEKPAVVSKPLDKIATNEQTPRCPHCGSVELEEMPPQNFLRWRCNHCRRHFRKPATGMAA
jgi:DNA-directed RNA polymerase subunit RPC12/RpoP